MFAERCHAEQRRESDDAPFIEHPVEVAELLREAGGSAVLVVAGLLHEVVEHSEISLSEVTARFGSDVAHLVEVVTDDGVGSYRQRKQVLREQVSSAGGDAAHLFAADTIAEVRELADHASREGERFDPTLRENHARIRLQRFQRMRLEHYHESLTMLKRVALRHPLVKQLATELHDRPHNFAVPVPHRACSRSVPERAVPERGEGPPAGARARPLLAARAAAGPTPTAAVPLPKEADT